MNEIAALITNVGFPITMCLLIMYYWNHEFRKEMEKLSDTVSQLNITVNKLLIKMGVDEDGEV